MEIHFEEKKRGCSYGCKQTKKPPFCDGVSLADLIMWCRQRIQTASASDSVARWVCLHDPPKLAPCNHKGMRYLVSMEEASGDAIAR